MFTINRDLLYKALLEIGGRIEACGASPELTNAVTLTSDLRAAVGDQYNPADSYALLRVLKAIESKDDQ